MANWCAFALEQFIITVALYWNKMSILFPLKTGKCSTVTTWKDKRCLHSSTICDWCNEASTNWKHHRSRGTLIFLFYYFKLDVSTWFAKLLLQIGADVIWWWAAASGFSSLFGQTCWCLFNWWTICVFGFWAKIDGSSSCQTVTSCS